MFLWQPAAPIPDSEMTSPNYLLNKLQELIKYKWARLHAHHLFSYNEHKYLDEKSPHKIWEIYIHIDYRLNLIIFRMALRMSKRLQK